MQHCRVCPRYQYAARRVAQQLTGRAAQSYAGNRRVPGMPNDEQICFVGGEAVEQLLHLMPYENLRQECHSPALCFAPQTRMTGGEILPGFSLLTRDLLARRDIAR